MRQRLGQDRGPQDDGRDAAARHSCQLQGFQPAHQYCRRFRSSARSERAKLAARSLRRAKIADSTVKKTIAPPMQVAIVQNVTTSSRASSTRASLILFFPVADGGVGRAAGRVHTAECATQCGTRIVLNEVGGRVPRLIE